MSDLMHSLKLDRGELAEAALATPAVIRPFDPDDDREAELLSDLEVDELVRLRVAEGLRRALA